MGPSRFIRAGNRRRRGAVLVEFAIVLPIFLLALIGIIEFGRAIMVQQILTNAARGGARRAIIPGASDSDVTTLVDTYLVNTSLDAPNRTIEIVDGNGAATSLANATSHSAIGVRVTVPYDEVGFGLGTWFGGSNLGSVVQMRKE